MATELVLSIGVGPSLTVQNGGLPVRIGENSRKGVVFFGVPGEGAEGQNIEYGGTGFLVGTREEGVPFSYLVTCRHVARALKEHEGTGFYVRINMKDGGSAPLPAGKVDWRYPKDASIDLAFCSFGLNISVADHIFFEIGSASVDRTKALSVVVGDDVSVVGLFRPHAGTGRNVPIVHTGNLAVLADPKELVPITDRSTGRSTRAELHLIEAQTLDGCSGAPVFLHETVTLDMFEAVDEMGAKVKAFAGVRLLGIYSGSWDGEPSRLLAQDRRLGPNRKVPVGMGTVVPVDMLIDAIREDEVMKKARKDFIAKRDADLR